jgi:hypothetical protein
MLKVRLYSILGFVAVAAVVFIACTSETRGPVSTPIPTTPKIAQENLAIITDRTGREWDVTHARDVYGMNPDYFNYGLGVGAIPSVDEPTILEEGDPDYPSVDSRTPVFGVDHNGEQRAYSVNALTQHEVFNDFYPGDTDQYLAVAY